MINDNENEVASNEPTPMDKLWDYVDRAAHLEFIINSTILRQLIEEAYGSNNSNLGE